MEGRVLGLVDHTHSPAAQLLDDSVMRDGLADHARGEPTSGLIVGGCARQVNEQQQGTTSHVGGRSSLSTHAKPHMRPSAADYCCEIAFLTNWPASSLPLLSQVPPPITSYLIDGVASSGWRRG